MFFFFKKNESIRKGKNESVCSVEALFGLTRYLIAVIGVSKCLGAGLDEMYHGSQLIFANCI